jgi:hypothetical protein
MNIENNSDLIEFINKEKRNYSELNHNKVYKYFCRCTIKTVNEIHEKFSEKEAEIDLKNGVIMGTNMLYHVFWILITYTNNIKLTIFLTERAILLFTEFILMSKEPNIKDDLCYDPNITDAVSFAYKKTIGSLKTSELLVPSSSEISYLKECSAIMKILFHECYQTYYSDTNLSQHLDNLLSSFRGLLYKIYQKKTSNHYIFEKVNAVIYSFNNYNNSTIFLKIFLDLFAIYMNKIQDIKKLHITFDNIFEKYKDYSFTKKHNIKEFKKVPLYNEIKKIIN